MQLLLLAGTPEAVQAGHALARERRVGVLAAVERAQRRPIDLSVPTRIGGWDTADDLAEWIEKNRVGAVLDMGHPFDTKTTMQCSSVCDQLDVPYVRYLRPSWIPRENDRWTFLNAEHEAANHIPEEASVFLATGRHNLLEFRDLGSRPIYVRVRELGGESFPFERGRFVARPARMPVTLEAAGLKSYGISWLVARNTGGSWTSSVVEAARELGLPVCMIRRPLQPEVLKVRSLSEAIGWVRRRL